MIFRGWRETPTMRRNRVKNSEITVRERQPHHIDARNPSGPPFFRQLFRNVVIASTCASTLTLAWRSLTTLLHHLPSNARSPFSLRQRPKLDSP